MTRKKKTMPESDLDEAPLLSQKSGRGGGGTRVPPPRRGRLHTGLQETENLCEWLDSRHKKALKGVITLTTRPPTNSWNQAGTVH